MSDKDSLFGSPPPSPPTRGRSPSLALPELSTWRLDDQINLQNVGTIALPGSHNQCSELPVFIDPALPRESRPFLSLKPPAQNTAARAPPARQRTTRTPSIRTRSPSRQPSPVPHNSQTDRTLRDLVGLISHFEPVSHATVPLSKPPPNPFSLALRDLSPGTAQNPIDVDVPPPTDAVNSALVALAGTVASALKLPTVSRDVPSLSSPTVNNVLHFIKHDPKLIPALQATYEYLKIVPNQPHHPPPRSFSHTQTNHPNHLSARAKRRKDKGPQIPAGAGHWNIPFPFATGQGPNSHPSQWQLDHGRRILGELLGLFERAFAKARGDRGRDCTAQDTRPTKRQRTRGPESVVESVRSDTEGSVIGGNDKTSAPPVGVDNTWLDHQRMSDWLSSVPAPTASSSSTDPASYLHSPSPSDPAPSSSNGFSELLALLGSNVPGDASATVGGNGDDESTAFDFESAFHNAGLPYDADGNVAWHSMFEPGPNSQSVNNITVFPMGVFEETALSHSEVALPDFALDPALMIPSQHEQTAHPLLSSSSLQPGQPHLTGLEFLPTASDTPTSSGVFDGAYDVYERGLKRSHPSSHDNEAEFARSTSISLPSVEQFIAQHLPPDTGPSLDARSLLTVPTTIASSQPQSRRGSIAPTIPSVGSSDFGLSTKMQRKAALLAKAKAHRERLVRELERARIERWGTVIEGGVLRNLQKAGLQ